MKKLLIGITSAETIIESFNTPARPVTLVNQAYVDLALSFNATPIILSLQSPHEHIISLLSMLDGLIFIGGQDIDPTCYNQSQRVEYSPHISGSGKPFMRPFDYRPSKKRDNFEIALYHAAKERFIPILGICRGLQIINVAEGGTLYQELPEPKIINHERGEDGFIHHHHIEINISSKIFEILKKQFYTMSSMHHQGIDLLAPTLNKAAWAEDGIIEIIELIDNKNFIVGVHGHIEQTRMNLKAYDLLLEAFFERALRSS
jgi:putative glutamine amidotransferase